MHQSQQPAAINSLLISDWNDICCLNLFHQAVALTWIIVSGSFPSKLTSSRLILSQYTQRIPISSLNVKLLESSIRNTILSLRNISYNVF